MNPAVQETFDFLLSEAARFGGGTGDSRQFVYRNNARGEEFDGEGEYFGIIGLNEAKSGPYHDLSIVIFPANDSNSWLLSLGVGSLGFKDDNDLARTPGVRRMFESVTSNQGYCKRSIADIESKLPENFLAQIPHLKASLKRYLKYLPACEVLVGPLSQASKDKISAYVATYAEIRNWPRNATERRAVRDAIGKMVFSSEVNDFEKAAELLLTRKFIVLEGPPGTGKTRLAKQIASELGGKTFLTQFHPDVSYSDFISGIRPKLDENVLSYEHHRGLFLQAVEACKENDKVVLIIDEINRANLSSVMGPLFYMMEYQREEDAIGFSLPEGSRSNSLPSVLPKNFYIIGTMNSADRSLAVVDFALRRRFAWYSLKPQALKMKNFFTEDFEAFNRIFYMHAESHELTFQPGQAYFIANSEKEMNQRIEFELYPLIKEYLAEGIMTNAKEEFNNYFVSKIGKTLFE